MNDRPRVSAVDRARFFNQAATLAIVKDGKDGTWMTYEERLALRDRVNELRELAGMELLPDDDPRFAEVLPDELRC